MRERNLLRVRTDLFAEAKVEPANDTVPEAESQTETMAEATPATSLEESHVMEGLSSGPLQASSRPSASHANTTPTMVGKSTTIIHDPSTEPDEDSISSAVSQPSTSEAGRASLPNNVGFSQITETYSPPLPAMTCQSEHFINENNVFGKFFLKNSDKKFKDQLFRNVPTEKHVLFHRFYYEQLKNLQFPDCKNFSMDVTPDFECKF